MRIALIADLHGNRPATKALERDIEITRPDAIWCLGDVVGKGPSNDFTCDWAFEHCELMLAGNWDLGASRRQFSADSYYWSQLGEERMERLRALPLERRLWLSGRRVRLFHGRPIMDELVAPHNDSEYLEPFLKDESGERFDVIIYADIHRQALRTLTPGLVVNIGSVGNALGVPECCYAILECEPGEARAPFEVRFRRLDYDRDAAVRDAESADGLNHADAYINEVRTGIYSR